MIINDHTRSLSDGLDVCSSAPTVPKFSSDILCTYRCLLYDVFKIQSPEVFMRLMTNVRVLVFCGLAISFLIFASVSTVNAQAECNSTSAPIATSGDISLADTAQSVRLFRDGRGSTSIGGTRPGSEGRRS